LHNEEQRYISDVEWWLTYEAWRVIVCSQYMRQELQGFFQLPEDKLQVIPNGVNPVDFKSPAGIKDLKKKYAPKGEKVIFFIGRLVQE
jgi:glycogen(starch) synthase